MKEIIKELTCFGVSIPEIAENLLKGINTFELDISSLENDEIKLNDKDFGFIYLIKNDDNHLIYLGKSKGSLFKSRLRSHLFGVGEGTKSRYKDFKGKNLTVHYFKVKPESLRNLLEEELIKELKSRNLNLLNYKPSTK